MESSESAPAGDGLQFDQAEYLAPETRACALCRAAIMTFILAAPIKDELA